MDEKVKILVTGATGFTGGEVLKYLSRYYSKDQLTGTGRNRQKARILEAGGFKMVCGNLDDEKFVKSNFSDITHIVHCAAKSDLWGSYDSFYKSNVIATKNIISIEGLKHIIYISTPSIYFDFKNRLDIKESDPLPAKFVNYYSQTKYLGELLIQEIIDKNIKRHIFRPRAIIGAGDETLMPRLLRAYNENRLKIIGDGKNIGDFTSVKNLAHIIYLTLQKKEQTSQIVFNVTDDNPVKLWDFINESLEKLGLKTVKRKVPYPVAFSVAALNEWYNKTFSKKEPVLTKYGVGVLNYSLTLNIDAAKRYLNYKPVITSGESIDEFVEWRKTQNS